MLKAKIIGCGLSGVTSAIILKERGYDVEIFDNRGHIAGNCYDTKENDVMLIANTGAYGHCMSSFYNLRPPAQEIVFDDGQ